MGRVLVNGPRDMGSIPGRVIPKTFKMVLDTSLFNPPSLYLSVVAIQKGAFWSPSTTVANVTYLFGFMDYLLLNPVYTNMYILLVRDSFIGNLFLKRIRANQFAHN